MFTRKINPKFCYKLTKILHKISKILPDLRFSLLFLNSEFPTFATKTTQKTQKNCTQRKELPISTKHLVLDGTRERN